MRQRKRLIRRGLWALVRWLDNIGGPPFEADRKRAEEAWDYAQADMQPWDAEPDKLRLSQGLSLRPDDPDRFSELVALAERDSPRALNEIGELYYWGQGVAIDKDEGERWFRRAFERGSWRGLLNYGKALYWRGDLPAAEAVFQVGVERDWTPALYWRARTFLRLPWRRGALSRARPLLERAMEKGSPAARAALGAFMATGFYGVGQIPRGRRLFSERMRAHVSALVEVPPPPRLTAAGETIH